LDSKAYKTLRNNNKKTSRVWGSYGSTCMR
jgi:hypothetical protein